MSELVPGAVIAGKYRLEREIGRGGMGSVWSARHLQLDTLVALKFVDPSAAAADAHMRFEREAKAAAQLRSPHVVQILDHGVDDGSPTSRWSCSKAKTWASGFGAAGRLSIPEAARIFGQAAKALRRAHDAGVIHRDLKPSNIFLARFDEDEVVKLLDFGVAKLRRLEMDPQNPATQTGVIFGSPTYMSPEQARGNKAIDHRSDLWSLAVILFRALTGQKPFEASSIGDLVIKLCIEPPPVPSRVATDLPAEIDRFFERAFAREPDRRFPSAMAMAAELEAIAQQHPSNAGNAPTELAPRASTTPPSGLSSSRFAPTFLPQSAPLLAASEPGHAAFVPPSQPTPASLSPHAIAAAPSQPTPQGPAPFVTGPAEIGAVTSAATSALPEESAALHVAEPTGARSLLGPSVFGESTGRTTTTTEPLRPYVAPASMTPSPTLLGPRASAPVAAPRTALVAVAALSVSALVLLVLVIAALRGGADTREAASPATGETDDRASTTASANGASANEASTTTPAAPSAEESARAANDPPASASAQASPSGAPELEAPAGSAAAEASAKVKPPPGKSGRRVPNFGY
jgi:serine/threonine protein kinase